MFTKTLKEMIMRSIELKHTKRLTLAVLTVVILGAGAFATKVPAQNAGVFEIDVPFDFVVNGRTFEADRYRIGRLNQANPDALVLKSSTGKTLLILQTQRKSGAPSTFTRLTFSLYGEAHFLDSIQASGESYESRLPSNKPDRRLRGAARLSQVLSVTNK